MTTTSSVWKYTISELFDVFEDIATNTPISNVIMEDEYLPVELDKNDGITNDQQQSQLSPKSLLRAVAIIDYNEAFRIAYGYYRIVVLQQKEVASYRTLLLTGTCLQLNPANYTVWHSRRQCLSQLYHLDDDDDEEEEGKDNDDDHEHDDQLDDANHAKDSSINTGNSRFISMIRKELHIAAILGGSNPKNYQIWYHRRAMLEDLPPHLFLQCITETMTTNNSDHVTSSDDTDLSSTKLTYLELGYIHSVLLVDEKNYHAWSHRQWIVSKMMDASSSESVAWVPHTTSIAVPTTNMSQTIYDEEITYCDNFINMDIRNNSAWNHRWYILHQHYCLRGGETTILLPFHVMEEEMDYAIQIISIDPYNESPCKYLVALVHELCELYANYIVDTDVNMEHITGVDQPFTRPSFQMQLHVGNIFQNVITQLNNIEHHNLVPNHEADQKVNNIDEMKCKDTNHIPSIHLCNALYEIYSCSHIWRMEQTNDEQERAIRDRLLSILQETDTIRAEYWKSQRKKH